MKKKIGIFLLIAIILGHAVNLSKTEWLIADKSGGHDDDAIEIHFYKDKT